MSFTESVPIRWKRFKWAT